MMNYCNNDCDFVTTFALTSKKFFPSEFSQHKINFKFFFESEYKYTLECQDSSPQLFRQYLPSSTEEVSAMVAVDESLSVEDVVYAVVKAAGDRLVYEDLFELVDLVWLEVNSTSPTETLPKLKADLHLRFDTRIIHMHVLAADPSFALSEKYGVNCVEEEDERRRIGLEERSSDVETTEDRSNRN